MTFRTSLSRWTCSAAHGTRRLGPTLLLAFLLALVSMTPHVAYAQKGKPMPPRVVLPPAGYLIQWLEGGPGWENVAPIGINQWGDVAGSTTHLVNANSVIYSSFAYHFATGQAFNLNELDAPWWDLNAAQPTLGTGWTVYWVNGLNDSGDIVGWAENMDPNLPLRAFVLEDTFDPAPRFLLLPTVGAGDHLGHSINNHGEIVGSGGGSSIRFQRTGDAWPYYVAVPQNGIGSNPRINDDGVVVSNSSDGAYRQLVSGAPADVFPGIEFYCIGNGVNPMIGGYIPGSGAGKKAVPAALLRLPVLGTANDIQRIEATSTGWVGIRSINDHGDGIFASGGRVFLFYDAISPNTGTRYGTNGDGILPLDQMVVNPDAAWLNNIRPTGITNRDGTGLGVICGYATTAPTRGFLLIPVPAP